MWLLPRCPGPWAVPPAEVISCPLQDHAHPLLGRSVLTLRPATGKSYSPFDGASVFPSAMSEVAVGNCFLSAKGKVHLDSCFLHSQTFPEYFKKYYFLINIFTYIHFYSVACKSKLWRHEYALSVHREHTVFKVRFTKEFTIKFPS